ncbi:MAG TPA: hypothetical protein VN327_08065 [Pseudonocardiaceae bacterium]|nr:hypothetical protein [Pseudonocardiaceae bacterium]
MAGNRGTRGCSRGGGHLVLRGPYRHVRNPMISDVLFVLLVAISADPAV